jgi:threonine dehydrogenase-like Zn-dependent dehydrogenase
MKSLAMVLTAFGRELEAREIAIPPLAEGEILVRITAAGVCGSDVHMYKGNDPRTPLPITLGHEGVGEIVETKGKRFTHTLNRNTTTAGERREIILQLTHGRGVDYAIEAVGTPAAVKEGIALVRTGGAYLSVGFGDPNGRVELDCYADLGRKNLTLQGVWVSATRHTGIALQGVLKNPSLFAKLVDRRLPLTEANLALELMARKETVKTVLLPAAGEKG